MNIFDAHCDVLYKMWRNKKINFQYDQRLHVDYESLLNTGKKNIQCFAIYIPESVHEQMQFQTALEMIDIFYQKILSKKLIKLVQNRNDIEELKDGEIGAVLTLEGCEAIGQDLTKLRTLFRLGVRSVGLTWNYSNAVADGALEPRGGGLTRFGRHVVQENNAHHVWTDVSHLSEQAFWDVIELADYVIASHSNAKALCHHPRNLTDQQIDALLKKDASIGVTFVPEFLKEGGTAGIKDVLLHIDHICALGGEKKLGFGSDFDGIENTLIDLKHYRDYERLIEELLKHYSEKLVVGFLYENFKKRFQ
ncbi:dipeptidase [Bacillus taeanensis]|uniref:Membrane dipeptidase n=1 Tax=Bacillus taeanensis TaxID=273032 RepID=A0A366XWJ2_9BACI|nr:dipeptidase [Bacillus taeanensis]RBW69918.1 membrane dipeptidase [Bacillus taeanensis]